MTPDQKMKFLKERAEKIKRAKEQKKKEIKESKKKAKEKKREKKASAKKEVAQKKQKMQHQSVVDVNWSDKDELVSEFARVWWYALPPEWPPKDYDYSEALAS